MTAIRNSRIARLFAALALLVLLAGFSLTTVFAQTNPPVGTEVLVIRQGVLYAYSPAANIERNITGNLVHANLDGTTPWVYSAEWSADGSYITMQLRNQPSAAGVWDTEGGVWLLNSAGVMVFNLEACFPDGIKCANPMLSSDNMTYVYTQVRQSDGHLSLWAVNTLTRQTRLLQDGGFTRTTPMGFRNNDLFVLTNATTKTVINVATGVQTTEAYTPPATPVSPIPAPIIRTCDGYQVIQNGTNINFLNGATVVRTIVGTLTTGSVVTTCPAGTVTITPIPVTATATFTAPAPTATAP